MDLNLVLTAVTPGIALAFIIYAIDKHDREPVKLLAKTFIGGALITIPTIFLESFLIGFNIFGGIIGIAYQAFIVAGFSEEFLKRFVVMRVAFISTKASLDYFNPISLAFWRFFIAIIALYIIKKIKYPEIKMAKEDRKLFFAGGITGVFLYFMFENYGMKYLTASTASILIAVIPVFTMVSETIINKEKITPKKAVSVILSVVGVIFIVGFDPQRNITDMVIGSILILLASISWVVYTFLSKPLYKKYTTITITYYQTLIGFVFFALLMPFNNTNIFNLPLKHI